MSITEKTIVLGSGYRYFGRGYQGHSRIGRTLRKQKKQPSRKVVRADASFLSPGTGRRPAKGAGPPHPLRRAGIRVLRPLVRRSEERGRTFRPYPPSVALQLCFCPLVGKRDISDEAGIASIQLPAASAGRATRILSLPVRRGDAQSAMGCTLLLR